MRFDDLTDDQLRAAVAHSASRVWSGLLGSRAIAVERNFQRAAEHELKRRERDADSPLLWD